MQVDQQDMIAEWERQSVLELYREYKQILWQQGLNLRPAHIELNDSLTHWGQWHSQTRTIRISKKLILKYSWFHVIGVLKHEMAHQLVEESNWHSSEQTIHGESFMRACQRLGVPDAFARSSVNLQQTELSWQEEQGQPEEERMLDKVRKLLALATSTNEHEAVLAMNRVREIYAKYNLEKISGPKKNQFVHLIIEKKSKRLSIYDRHIISILVGHFFVQVITGTVYKSNLGRRTSCIEIIGARESVLMAEYVYHFLYQQLEHLVTVSVKNQQLENSHFAKKSYKLGLLTGFADKLVEMENFENRSSDQEVQNVIGKALLVFKKDPALKNYIKQIYPKLTTTYSGNSQIEDSAFNAGKTDGRKINLRKSMTSNSKNAIKLLRAYPKSL